MVKVAQAVVETPRLQSWFFGLENLTSFQRQTSFRKMAAEMRRDGENLDLADAVASLKGAALYHAMVATVRERIHERNSEARITKRSVVIGGALALIVILLSAAFVWSTLKSNESFSQRSRASWHKACPWCQDDVHYATCGPYFNREMSMRTSELLSCSLRNLFYELRIGKLKTPGTASRPAGQ
jgi:hypothetical protein